MDRFASNLSQESNEGATLIRRVTAVAESSPASPPASAAGAVAVPVLAGSEPHTETIIPRASFLASGKAMLLALPDAVADPEGLLRAWPAVLRLLAKDAYPIATNLLIFFLTQAITLAFVGKRLGTDLQAGFAVALSVFNVCGMSICIGFLSGLDTLCSQSIGRDPSGRELPALVHRGVVVGVLLTLPIIALFFAIEPALVWGFGATLGHNAAVLLRCMPVYIVSNTLQYGLQRPFQAHQAAHLSLYAGAAMLAICPVANALLTVESAGLPGAAAAVTVTNVCGTLLTVGLALLHPESKIRGLPAGMASRSLAEYRRVVFDPAVREVFAVSLPALASVCADWWAFEVLLLSVARYGPLLADTFSVTFSILVLMICSPAGAASAAGARIGNALGADQPVVAEAWTRVAFVVNTAFALVDGTLLYLLGGRVVGIYTSDARVIALFTFALPAIMLMHGMDSLSSCCQNAFRGAGRQALAARISLGTLWGIGLPLSIALTLLAPNDTLRFPMALGGFAVGLAVTAALCARDIKLHWDWAALAHAAHHKRETAADEGTRQAQRHRHDDDDGEGSGGEMAEHHATTAADASPLAVAVAIEESTRE